MNRNSPPPVPLSTIAQEIEDLKQVRETVVLKIEEGAIRKYADAVGDRNPIYWDAASAHEEGYPGLVAPPGFFGWPEKWHTPMPFHTHLRERLNRVLTVCGYTRQVNGGVEYEFLGLAYAGQSINVTHRLHNVTERETRSGRLVLALMETTYSGLKGERLAVALITTIYR